MNTTMNTTIGLWNDYEASFIVDVADLKKKLETCHTWTVEQYCDRRFSTNLVMFVYDPFTGVKIDWKRVKELLKE